MSSAVITTDIGAGLKLLKGTPPAASAAGAVNGAAINRQGFESCVLHAGSGAATGSPTTQALDAKLQDSADGSTGWADLSGAAITQITAVNSEAHVNVNLRAAKQFIRVVTTVAFTGGTAPTLGNEAAVVLGGIDTKPPAAY